MARPVRFGFLLSGDHLRDPVAAARRAEALGFDVVLASDHLGSGPAPLPVLAAIAAATSRIRLGTLVLNASLRNPVQVAWEAVTLDRLSDGRFELGLGAGHTPQEFTAAGVAVDPPRRRKERLAEVVEVVRRLLDGETVDHHGTHVRVEGATVGRTVQDRLPVLVGGNGAALLAHAGAHADIVGLQGLGRTLADGHSHTVRWDPAWLATQVEQVRRGAGERAGHVELNALVQVVSVTDDRAGALAAIAEGVEGLELDHAAATPYLLVGTVDEIAEQVVAAGERWGISYVAVRELDALAPVLDVLRDRRVPGGG